MIYKNDKTTYLVENYLKNLLSLLVYDIFSRKLQLNRFIYFKIMKINFTEIN